MAETQTIETQITVRKDTKANWEQVNPTLAAGEPSFQTDTKKVKFGDGNTSYNNLDALTNDSEIYHAKQGIDRLYEGKDLAALHATEIAGYTDIYAWLNARKTAGNFEGIHIGDYFTVAMSAGTVAGNNIAAQSFKCRIVGINTYKGCSDQHIGDMFYIMSDEVITQAIKWNPTDNNNGTAVQEHPWLASAAYAILNGINNYTTTAFNNIAHGANASTGGILQLLPASLQSVLKQKRNLLAKRYSASGLLTGGTGWGWLDMGKLWLPNEIEVYGCQLRSNLCQTEGYWNPEAELSIQFPWFANKCENRVKKDATGAYRTWWLSSSASYYSASVCSVSSSGLADNSVASNAGVCLPLCFCI